MATQWSRCLPVGILVAGLSVLAAGAGAHHGTTVFDRSNPIEVTGVVREFRWTSPHAWIFIDVPQVAASNALAAPPLARQVPDSMQWAFEGAAISVMVRHGWKSGSLRPGDHVKVVAAPRRDGTRTGEFLSVTLTDSGKVLQLAGP